MYQRGIRGAITVDNNSVNSLEHAVVELITEIQSRNNFKVNDISHVIFTLTDDINCVYPAKIARDNFPDWKYVPMMCMPEMKIIPSLNKCLRVLVVINTNIAQQEINHIYLKGASILRKDLNKV